jgi:hypothetical protein
MSCIERYLKEIASEKKMIGEIIDDRSMNSIPLGAYAQEYKQLERIEQVLKAEQEGRCVVLPVPANRIIVEGSSTLSKDVYEFIDGKWKCTGWIVKPAISPPGIPLKEI